MDYSSDKRESKNHQPVCQGFSSIVPLDSSISPVVVDDPWGEGDFEEEADASGGVDLLEALDRADKIFEDSGISFSTSDGMVGMAPSSMTYEEQLWVVVLFS